MGDSMLTHTEGQNLRKSLDRKRKVYIRSLFRPKRNA